jgi:hypothetical protein
MSDRINHVKIATPDPEGVRRFLLEVVDIPDGWSIGAPESLRAREVMSPARDGQGEFTRSAVLAFRGGPPEPVGLLVGDGTSRGVQVVLADEPRIWSVAIGTRDVEGAHARATAAGLPCTELRDGAWGDDGAVTFFYAEVGGVVFEVLRVNS